MHLRAKVTISVGWGPWVFPSAQDLAWAASTAAMEPAIRFRCSCSRESWISLLRNAVSESAVLGAGWQAAGDLCGGLRRPSPRTAASTRPSAVNGHAAPTLERKAETSAGLKRSKEKQPGSGPPLSCAEAIFGPCAVLPSANLHQVHSRDGRKHRVEFGHDCGPNQHGPARTSLRTSSGASPRTTPSGAGP